MKSFIIAIVMIGLGCGTGYGLTVYLWGATTGFDPLAPLSNVEIDPWLAPTETGPQPKLVIDETVVELGVQPLDARVTHDYLISNAGEAVLRIRADKVALENYELALDGKPVAVSESAKQELAPGESATLTVSWMPDGSENEGVWTPLDGPGRFSRVISLASNDKRATRTLLTMSGERVPFAHLEEGTLKTGLLEPDQEITLQTRVYSYTTDDLKFRTPLFGNSDTAEFYDVSWEKLTAAQMDGAPQAAGLDPKAGYQITVRVQPGLPMGQLFQSITLPTQQPSRSKVQLKLTGEVRSDVSMSGENWNRISRALGFGRVYAPDGGKCEMRLSFVGEYRNKLNLRLESTTPDCINVEIGEPQTSENGEIVSYRIVATIPANSAPVEFAGPFAGGEYGALRFATDHPQLQTLEVPVVVTILQ